MNIHGALKVALAGLVLLWSWKMCTWGGFLPTEFTAKGEVIAYTRIKQPFPVELGCRHRIDTLVSMYRKRVPALYSSSYTGDSLYHLVGEIEYYLFDHPEKLYEVVPPWHPWYGPEHNETIRDYILDHFWIDAYTDHKDPRIEEHQS